MKNHFDKNLNLKKWILERRPRNIVECGAGNGELTRKLVSLLEVYEFNLCVISDKELEGIDSRINWEIGLSYELLEKFGKDSIDLCIIDTDHNYWTLMKELTVLFNRISIGGMIAMHDVHTFYHDTGMALSYWNGKPYPRQEILKYAENGSLGDALIDFLQLKKLTYRMLAYTSESHGAALIEKKPQKEFAVYVPGEEPVFAQKEAVNA